MLNRRTRIPRSDASFSPRSAGRVPRGRASIALATAVALITGALVATPAAVAAPAGAAEPETLVHYDMSFEGSVLKDISGRGKDARLVGLGAANFVTEGADQALKFNGTGYVELPNFIGSEQAVVVELRYKVGTRNNEGLFTTGTSSSQNHLRFHPLVTGQAVWESRFGNRWAKIQGPVTYAPDAYATTTAVLKNDGTYDAYVNGGLLGNGNMGTTAPQLNNGSAVFGYLGRSVWTTDPYFTGTLTDVIVRTYESTPPPVSTNSKVVSTTFPTKSSSPATWWRAGMVTGNGENGAVIAGNPLADTIIYQNMALNMPTNDKRDTPDLASYLPSVRQQVFSGLDPRTATSWGLQLDYTYHPAHQLNLRPRTSGPLTGNWRWTDYETGEVGVDYVDDGGKWERTTFASRPDNVVVTRLSSSSTGARVNLDFDVAPIDEMAVEGGTLNTELRYKQFVDPEADYIGQVAHYPSFANSELKNGGFAGVTYVVAKGGHKEPYEVAKPLGARAVPGSKYYGISITDADEVFLISKSARDKNMGAIDEFAAQQDFGVVDQLRDDIEAVISKPEYVVGGSLDYNALLAPHAAGQREEFNAVKLDLPGAEADSALSNEALIAKQQQNAGALNPAMVERAFNAGRYATISSSGFSTPRLGGMWAGGWNSAWQADWTTDANVNLQIAGANIGNLPTQIEGYANFILRTVPEWETNARKIYGMTDALLAPPRTDSDRAGMVHFSWNGGMYPFEYWNAGASWLILPLYEYWMTRGDAHIPLADDIDVSSLASVLSPDETDLSPAQLAVIEDRGYLRLVEDLLLPLLRKQSNFWEQFVDPQYYGDATQEARYQPGKTALADGEHYLLLPCYSPENRPLGGNSSIAINCTMDIAAARDGLRMTIEAEKYVNGADAESAERIAGWESLRAKLPPPTYDSTGALREWSLSRYTENHAHRHVSHAYFAWPAHDLTPEIIDGLKIAMELRKSTAGDKQSGHGWLHMGLVDARLKNAQGATESLLQLLGGSAYYSSFTTNHNVNGASAYASDILNTVPTLLLETLVYSDEGEIQILPALPTGMNAGSVSGSMARTQAEVTSLQWDVAARSATVTLTSSREQTIDVSSGIPWASAVVDGVKVRNNGAPLKVAFDEGESKTIVFALGEPGPVDAVAPDVSAVTSPAAADGVGGWFVSPVSVSVSASDAGSGVASVEYRLGDGAWGAYSSPVSIPEGTTTFSYRATDEAGNVSAVGQLPVKADATAPVTSVVVSPGSGVVLAGSTVSATFTATDAGSGVASTEYSTDGGATWVAATDAGVSFTEVGQYVVKYRSVDAAGNVEEAKEVTLTVVQPWTFTGFYAPVDMGGVVNVVKGGSTVPLKFELFSGEQELTSTTAIDSLRTVQHSCDPAAPVDEVETVVAGGTALVYDTQAGRFQYNWKTPKSTGCMDVIVRSTDGSELKAQFRLK
ncbi:glycosyl hydrolase family 95 catalytic domain-containing protein [Microbacterium sp. E-13]|uniref:glycosyl hydrolase family 95 catalytic domain-containing protein n=1 Tax=Microbacterium sp. E-13 TaxID=3404048 RepID=UPI003CECA199